MTVTQEILPLNRLMEHLSWKKEKRKSYQNIQLLLLMDRKSRTTGPVTVLVI